MTEPAYQVRAVRCDHRATDEQVYRALVRATEPLTRSWERLARARKVVLKFNMMESTVEYFAGRRRELVDDAVARAVLRLLRERTSARLVATDTNPYGKGYLASSGFNYQYLLDEFGVEFVDSSLAPLATFAVPGGGGIFDRYLLNATLADADAAVSIAKLKSHLFAGVTLCTKNLFGLPPMIPPEGKTRSYFHHLIRLPYVLADLAMIVRPCLNIVDGLVGQWGREWRGQGRIADALIAGDHPIATDACTAHLMGHDPEADWPTPPFRRDRNHLLIAAQRGYGTVKLREIDFAAEVTAPLAEFDAEELDPPATVASWRYTACEQGLYYRDHRAELVDRYAGQYIYLQDGEVVWNGPDPTNLGSRRVLSGDRKDRALWLKLVDPAEWEGERFAAYEECLNQRT
ncbi:MAG: DUF362 domain-containing protein [Candidatus Latescibacterota bacterium]|jgi:uncharacterized protein (DUF362 family)